MGSSRHICGGTCVPNGSAITFFCGVNIPHTALESRAGAES